MYKKPFFLIVALAAFTLNSCIHSGNQNQMKKSILLVAFGTSVPEAEKAFDNIRERISKRFPETEIKWAYTSNIIRKKLAKQGRKIDSPKEAFAKFAESGITDIVVQSLHTIPGAEFHEIVKAAAEFEKKHPDIKISIGNPLLTDSGSVDRMADILIADIPAERKKSDAVIYMGHGSEHHVEDMKYTELNKVLNSKDPNIYLGTVEGKNLLDPILKACREKGMAKAYLIPFMSVAGDHAINDMAGPGEDSWKSRLEKAGIKTVPILKGTAEVDAIVDVWADNLNRQFKR